MPRTTGGTPGTQWDIDQKVRDASTALASFRAIVKYVDDMLAIPADLRPRDDFLDQRRAQEVGLPIALRRFDRVAFERGRDEIARMIEAEFQNTVAASRA